MSSTKTLGISVVATMVLLSLTAVGMASYSDAAVDNDQGTVSYYTYTVDFAFVGQDAANVLWDFGFESEEGVRATSTEWNPQGIVFPGKGTYVVTQIVSNSVGTYTSQLKIEILGTPEITFQTFGGTEVPVQTVKVGHTVEKPEDPVKAGYTFDGWYTDTGFNNPFSFSTPVSQHMSLYAKWTVSSPVNPGSGDDGNTGDDGNDKDDDKGDETWDDGSFEFVPLIAGLLGLCLVGVYLKAPAGRRNNAVVAVGAVCLAIAGAQYLFGIDIVGMLLGGANNE